MMMFPHTITLYHKTGETWQKIIVENVLWDDLKARLMRKTGTDSADKVVCYIPKVINGTARDIPIADGDVIVKGVYDKEIVRSTKELENALFVNSVADYDFGGDMASWVVTAR